MHTEPLVRLLGEAASVDVVGADEDELLRAARDLEIARSLLESASGHLAVELDGRRVTDRHSGLGTGTWLAQSPRQDRRDCQRRLRIAKSLRSDFQLVDTAVAEGRLSWSHASVITAASNRRIRGQMSKIQSALIDAADGCQFARWADFVKGVARQLDVDGGHNPAGDLGANRLGMQFDSDGALVFTGELVGEHALVSEAAITKVADELFRSYGSDAKQDPALGIPDRRVLQALALAEICRRAMVVPLDSGRPPVNLTTMIVHSDDPTSTVYTPNGGRFPAEMADALRCDEAIRTLVMSSTGVPLHMGRSSRLATPAQREAVLARDGGCVHPGCDAPASHCVIHHTEEFHAHGGLTDIGFLAAGCPHHHGVWHQRGWKVDRAPDDWFTITTPSGKTLHSQRHGRQRSPAQRGVRSGRRASAVTPFRTGSQ